MTEPKPANVKGADVPIVKLIPLRKRKISPKGYSRMGGNA